MSIDDIKRCEVANNGESSRNEIKKQNDASNVYRLQEVLSSSRLSTVQGEAKNKRKFIILIVVWFVDCYRSTSYAFK